MDKRETAAWRDQQADAMGSVNDFIECSETLCDTSERWKDIKNSEDWQVSNDPEIPLLCPECSGRTPDENLPPSEARKKFNRSITEF